MCQFNLLIVDKESDSESLKKILSENGLGYRELENKSLTNQLGDAKRIILTTKGQCDCGSILGINHQAPQSGIEIEKETKKLKKKKWSKSKIERYLKDKLKEQDKNKKEQELDNETEENNWIRTVQALKKQKIQIGILFHHFNGLIEDEKIDIEKTNQIQIERSNKGEFRNFKENQLNQITK